MIQFDKHIFQMGWNHQLVLESARNGQFFSHAIYEKNGRGFGKLPGKLSIPKDGLNNWVGKLV